MTEPAFFDFAAEMGLTKHIGGVEATQTLVELCGVGPGARVLDVGCGVGITACWLAKKYACRVVGVDLREKMVEHSRARAKREGLAERVEFRAADAQALPLDDDHFDIVITESVTAFPADKARAAREYARVTRPGGAVGLNEATWLKFPPPQEISAWLARSAGAEPTPLTDAEWVVLLENAGLKVIVGKTYSIDLREESQSLVRRYGLGEALRITGRILDLYLRSADYRRFVMRIKNEGLLPANLTDYFGYGLFVAKKPGPA